jgi:hypothetical protein
MRQQYAGSDWIRDSLKITNMSPLGIAVADLLGDLYLGIYHLNTTSLRKVNWNDPQHIEVAIGKSMVTYDENSLTRLVVLAHDRMIRIKIKGAAPNFLRLTFHQRKSREGSLYQRMPELETHIETIRNHYKETES